MAKRKSRKTVSWRELIAHALVEVGTFDLNLDDGGFPTVHWLIAQHLLSRQNQYIRTTQLESYAKKVSTNLDHACDILEERGIPVYRTVDAGKKCISVITLNPNYGDARNKEAEKLISTTVKKVARTKERLDFTESTSMLPSMVQQLSLLDWAGVSAPCLPSSGGVRALQ